MGYEDLMRGDWVSVTLNGKASIYGRVGAIFERHIEVLFDDGTWTPCQSVDPIPLTLEILIKNGFKKDRGDEECLYSKAGWMVPNEYNRKAEPISWETEIIGKNSSFDGVITYVHQLQHAFKLCKIRKQIIL